MVVDCMGEGSFEEAGSNNILKSIDYSITDNKAIKTIFESYLGTQPRCLYIEGSRTGKAVYWKLGSFLGVKLCVAAEIHFIMLLHLGGQTLGKIQIANVYCGWNKGSKRSYMK